MRCWCVRCDPDEIATHHVVIGVAPNAGRALAGVSEDERHGKLSQRKKSAFVSISSRPGLLSANFSEVTVSPGEGCSQARSAGDVGDTTGTRPAAQRRCPCGACRRWARVSALVVSILLAGDCGYEEAEGRQLGGRRRAGAFAVDSGICAGALCRLENLGERVPGRRSGGRGAPGASERAPPFNAGHSVNGLVNETQVR
jgi:hypothetical protein